MVFRRGGWRLDLGRKGRVHGRFQRSWPFFLFVSKAVYGHMKILTDKVLTGGSSLLCKGSGLILLLSLRSPTSPVMVALICACTTTKNFCSKQVQIMHL